MQGIKGFSKELATSYGSGVKLEPGKTYKEEECKVYRNGWHFVEYAPDCLNYFPLGAGNRYFLIEAAGDINEEQHFRCCCTEITLVKELDLKAFAGMSMKYMIQNPKMDWERAAAHLQIKQEIARAQKGEIAIARGRNPKVYLQTGAVGGLMEEDINGVIVAARVFLADKDGTYFLNSGEVRREDDEI